MKLKTLSSVAAALAVATLSTTALAGKVNSANVMAPLYMGNDGTQWSNFNSQLAIAKDMDIDAVTVDVWWGLVEGAGDQQFDWSYYEGVVHDIQRAGLQWIPIMSFHQCGGNVGDDCNIPIPSWIWGHYGINPDDMKYRSERDNYATETVSLWQDHRVREEYLEFMDAFEAHFGWTAYMTQEINVSAGSAGELRYPSYNAHDGEAAGYPSRGFFQAYSNPARADFRNWVLSKYGNLASVNNAWGFNLSSTNQIGPPDDGSAWDGRAQWFVSQNEHFDTQYGRDFIEWYNAALMNHGRVMLEVADQALDGGAFNSTPIGLKMAGVHWQMMDNAWRPRISEITAGLIPTNVNVGSSSSGHGYNTVMQMVQASQNATGRHHIFHFTCLEKDNREWDGGSQAFSRAQDLVFWVANAAAAYGIEIKGENALAGGVMDNAGWNNIDNAVQWASYTGLTTLRINNVTWNQTGRQRYENFIRRFK